MPNNKTIAWPYFKAFADDNLNVAKMAKLVFDRVETIPEKEKKLVTSIFSFSHNVSKVYFLRVVESWDCVVKA